MARDWFRTASKELPHGSTPMGELALRLQVVDAHAWLALLAAGLCVAAVLAWCVFGVLPLSVSGRGIIVREGGTFALTVGQGGRLTSLAPLAPGSMVAQDEIVAHVDGREVRAAEAGMVVEVLARRGDSLRDGQALLNLEAGDGALQAVVYLPAEGKAKLVQPGMAVQVSPADIPVERFGTLAGEVLAVSRYPASEAGMMAVIHHAGLVQQIARDGPVHAVTVKLLRDAGQAYRWSARHAPRAELSSGTLLTASVTIEELPPASLVLPALRRLAGL